MLTLTNLLTSCLVTLTDVLLLAYFPLTIAHADFHAGRILWAQLSRFAFEQSLPGHGHAKMQDMSSGRS